MTSHASAPRLTAAAVTRLVRKATGSDLFTSSAAGPHVVRVSQRYAVAGALASADLSSRREERARLAAAALLQAGYEVAREFDRLTVTLPAEETGEPEVAAATVVEQDAPLQGEVRYDEHGARYWTAEEVAAERAATVVRPAGPVSYRKVGGGLYEVVREGVAIGRVARTTPEHVTFGARWSSYTTTGERVYAAATSRADAAERLVEHLGFARVDADTITDRRELLAAVEVQTRHLGYASAAAYLQAPGREVTRARALVAAYAPDGPAMPAGVGGCDCSAVPGPHLAHCDDCSAPADACVCPEEPADGSAPGQDAGAVTDPHTPAERLAARYGLPVVDVVTVTDEVLDEALAPSSRHWSREEVLDRFREVDSFVLQLGPDDTAYDPETGDTLLGGVTIRYARGEFPGPSYTATIVDDEPGPGVDDPREQPAPLEWSEVASGAPSLPRREELPRAVRYR